MEANSFLFSLEVVHVQRKRGRLAPILFTEVKKDAITTLINSMEKVGVRKDNIFVFSAPTRASLKHI